MGPAGQSRRRRFRRAVAPVTLGMLVCAFAVTATTARAGDWMQVSCVNPDGSAAPSEGWSAVPVGGPSAPIMSSQCSPGTPMEADLSDLAAASPNSGAYLQYQPPPGSTLVGGRLDATLSADGYGDDSSGQPSAAAIARLSEATIADPFFQCVAFFTTCGARPDFSGQVSLPSDAGGDLYADAECSSSTGTSCDANPMNGAWALAQIASAQLLLNSSVSPTGSGFTGSALQGRVRGTGHVVFTAAEAAGPGIYEVAVSIDGKLAWAGTPNDNGGECASVGTDPTTGALMFDHQQPCLDTEVVDAPVPTAGLSDGPHELAVAVTDAAGNTSTVLDQTITASNPQTTPSPRGAGSIRARFVISWRWSGTSTVLRSITVNHLPRSSGVAVHCTGKGCPRLRIGHEDARRVSVLLRSLEGRRFHVGAELGITVTERHHRAERVQLLIRAGQIPLARLAKR